MTKKRGKRGPDPLPPEIKRSKLVRLYLTPSEFEAWEAVSGSKGMTPNEHLKKIVDRELKKVSK